MNMGPIEGNARAMILTMLKASMDQLYRNAECELTGQ